MRYKVYMINAVSKCIEVEANNPDEAVDLAYESDDMPGSITVGAFGPSSVDDGEWMAQEVTDESGETVWQQS